MYELTCDHILGGRWTTLVVLHHLQLDLILLARSQAGLLKGGLWTTKGVENRTVLLFLPASINNSLATTRSRKRLALIFGVQKKKRRN